MNDKLIDYLIAREGMVATFGLGTLMFLIPAASFLLQKSATTEKIPSESGLLQLLLTDLSSTIILVLLACCAPALGMVMKQVGARLILWLKQKLFRKIVGTTSTADTSSYASLAFADTDTARLYVVSVATTTGGLGLAMLTGCLVTFIASLWPALEVGLWAIPIMSGLIGFLLILTTVLLVRPALDYI